MIDLMKRLDKLNRMKVVKSDLPDSALGVCLKDSKRGPLVNFEQVKTIVGQAVADYRIPDFLVIGAFRYALGRQTYVTQETSGWLIANWNSISSNAQFVIDRDLKEEIEHDNRRRAEGSKYRPLGADIDRAEWLKLAERIKT